MIMASYQKTMANFSLSLLAGIAITDILFVFQPLLTKFANLSKTKERGHTVVIQQYKPPPPPEFQEEERIQEKQKTTQTQKEQQIQRMQRPKIDMAMSGLTGSLGGTIEISSVLNKDFKVSDSLFVSAFKLSEVDEPPKPIKTMLPKYPFEAKQKGISGKVTLRFVVDSNGVPREPQVVSADPPGVFEEAALEVVVKYKFRPAKKAGKAVDCIVKLPISFDLSE
jgi:protein TonB